MSQQTLTRREKQLHTRKCLLEAATRVFSKKGLEGTSVDQVAQTAGYTKGAFYANFKSKEELFLVMLDEHFSRELERLESALTGTENALDEAMAAAADFISFAGDDDWPRLYFQFVAHAAQDDEFRQELATRTAAMRERMGQILQRWKEGYIQEGEHAPSLPIEQITAMLCFMADGFLVERMIEPDLPEELYTTMVGIFHRGMKAMAEDQAAAG